MPPANLHGESTPDFIVPIYIECRFEFIEAFSTGIVLTLFSSCPYLGMLYLIITPPKQGRKVW